MWKRNTLFVALCLAGLGSLSAMLLTRERIADPVSFDPHRYEKEDFREVIDQVNREFRDHWGAQGIVSAAKADSFLVARRLSLGLMGTVPSVEELRALERRTPEERLDWWTSRLLADRRYSDYVGERLARAYVGTDAGPFLLFRRRRFVTWLSEQLAANRAYDEIVRELITAKGLWTDEPAVNFLTATSDANNGNQPSDIKLAARTTRAFLALRLDCLECHDDKLGTIELGTATVSRDGLQSDFHQLAAYFSQAETSLFGIRDGSETYKYKYLHAEKEAEIQPRPPFLPELIPSVPTRREQLARWVTHAENKPFARAAVNRVWAILFGRPLVASIDSISLNGPFPPGMETLAADFVKHHYDLQRLIRVIVGTDVFQLDSRGDLEVTAAHEKAFAVYPLTRLRPEQVAGGIIQSSSLATIDANAHIIAQLGRFFQQQDFVSRYGDTGEDEFADQAGTITQRLLMMNGDLVHDRTKTNYVANAATRIAALAPNDKTAVDTAYLAVLTRHPTPVEQEHFTARIANKRGGARTDALEDLYWVLINSSEFTWNH